MTEAEIIKALECCSMGSYPACRDCPYHDDYVNRGCINKRNADIKDLINRQKAEIERLKEENDKLAEDWSNLTIEKDQLFDEAKALIEKAKAEAIKEFAERLKTDYGELVYYGDVNKLVKEMAGDTK